MSSPAPALTCTLHLVRHGEVENPKGLIYGRLPGYNLSERGRRQAQEAGQRLRDADLGSVWASPLERAQETAQAIAEPHGLEVVTDVRLTESGSTLEGVTRGIAAIVRSPRHLWRMRNPWRPSWGETFDDIRARMYSVAAEACAGSPGQEIALVSHQTPVLVARLGLARRRMPPWLARVPCETGSVTTLVLDGGRVVEASYFRPSA